MGNMWFPPENIEATNEFGKKQRIYIYIYIIYIYPMDPSTFLGSVWDMIWGVKYLLRRCLDP